MTKYHDDNSYATNPGNIVLSRQKLKQFHPALFTLYARFASVFTRGDQAVGPKAIEVLEEHLELGDACAAVVVGVSPLLIAAYSGDIDCVVILRFSQKTADDHRLKVGDRLLTVNTYATRWQTPIPSDIQPGPRDTGVYSNFHPLIADFLSDDEFSLEARKKTIDENEWARARQMGEELVRSGERGFRDGSPLHSMDPVT